MTKGETRRRKICFVGSSLSDLRKLDETVKSRIGFQLRKVQEGLLPDDYKPMSTIGVGVLEIRVESEDGKKCRPLFLRRKV